VAERRFVLWGSAGHARVLVDLLARLGARVVATFDNDERVAPLPGLDLHVGPAGFQRWLAAQPEPGTLCGLAAIGGSRGRDRLAIQELFARHGLQLPPVVHPQAALDRDAELGAGTQVLAQAVVAAGTRLGAACIVNHRAGVDHECVLGDGVHVGPGATLCGLVRVGSGAFVGAGAVVLPRLTIGADAIVGAGAVVTRDVPEGAVVAGNPARPIQREPS
jgi:sugar O-acyltransferase (sialic acid O-acetyltransferase NeuD family)